MALQIFDYRVVAKRAGTNHFACLTQLHCTALRRSVRSIPTNYKAIVFLDRDGVINRKPGGSYVTCWEEFIFLPRVADAIRLLNESQHAIVVVTNQRGVALGFYSEEELASIHQKMLVELQSQGARIDAVFYCPHNEGTCECRKPGVKLFRSALEKFPEATAEHAIVVGDSVRDMQAAAVLGCRRILVGEDREQELKRLQVMNIDVDFSAPTLYEAVRDFILAQSKPAASCVSA